MIKPDKILCFLILTSLIGIGLFSYPMLGRMWNSLHTTKVATDYVKEVGEIDDETLEAELQKAREYNERHLAEGNSSALSAQERAEYESLLDVLGNGIMGYVELPTLEQTLPIYHGTDESVLQVGVGHTEWSSLPVGGKGTHAVISGHSGLATKTLFTNLDKLEEGDIFRIRVLNQTLSYEVDQISVILPAELHDLEIDPEEDYCTLVTCTPYGVNTHRLLVRGHRITEEEQGESEASISRPLWMEPMVLAFAAGILILVLLIIAVWMKSRKKKTKSER